MTDPKENPSTFESERLAEERRKAEEEERKAPKQEVKPERTRERKR